MTLQLLGFVTYVFGVIIYLLLLEIKEIKHGN